MTREWGPLMDTKSETANGHELTRMEDLTADGRGCTHDGLFLVLEALW
jgi:hypothetical protein